MRWSWNLIHIVITEHETINNIFMPRVQNQVNLGRNLKQILWQINIYLQMQPVRIEVEDKLTSRIEQKLQSDHNNHYTINGIRRNERVKWRYQPIHMPVNFEISKDYILQRVALKFGQGEIIFSRQYHFLNWLSSENDTTLYAMHAEGLSNNINSQ